jgi:hypothetical protein
MRDAGRGENKASAAPDQRCDNFLSGFLLLSSSKSLASAPSQQGKHD